MSEEAASYSAMSDAQRKEAFNARIDPLAKAITEAGREIGCSVLVFAELQPQPDDDTGRLIVSVSAHGDASAAFAACVTLAMCGTPEDSRFPALMDKDQVH